MYFWQYIFKSVLSESVFSEFVFSESVFSESVFYKRLFLPVPQLKGWLAGLAMASHVQANAKEEVA